ncbi:MAG: hypothetical protein HY701_08480, partial [Gemmatimonadetes bacterium]|nr:hypothetical protein [Gemmatimonadota bacterium]
MLLCAAAPAAAQQQGMASDAAEARGVPLATALRVNTSPVIDGVLDDRAWTTGEALGGFVQQEPVEGRPVSQGTEVKILFDEEALYIGAWLYQPPEDVVLGERLRDSEIDDSDAFVVVLDTYLDQQNGYVFGTNPLGIEYDGQVIQEGGGGFGGGGGGAGGPRAMRGGGGGFNRNWDGDWNVA